MRHDVCGPGCCNATTSAIEVRVAVICPNCGPVDALLHGGRIDPDQVPGFPLNKRECLHRGGVPCADCGCHTNADGGSCGQCLAGQHCGSRFGTPEGCTMPARNAGVRR